MHSVTGPSKMSGRIQEKPARKKWDEVAGLVQEK